MTSTTHLRALLVGLLVSVGLAGAPSCATDGASGGDSSSHWLHVCVSDVECGGLSCTCGRCTKQCTETASCSGVSKAATCTALLACPSATLGCVARCTDDAACAAVGKGLRCWYGQCGPFGPSEDAGTNAVSNEGGAHDAGKIEPAIDAAFPDAGSPPTDCIAPCVWEVVKGCLPSGSCVETTSEIQGGLGHSFVDCAGADWSANGSTVSSVQYQSSATINVAGKVCFSVRTQGAPPTMIYISGWVDATGTLVAAGTNGNIACGPPDALATIEKDLPSSDPRLTRYSTDMTQPHCAPWRALSDATFGTFSCRSGSCPSSP